MSHKLTPSHDGQQRLELVVKARFTLMEIATFIASNFVANTTGRNEVGGILIDMQTIKQILPNKKSVLKIANEVLLIDGTELPTYRISDNNLEELRDQVLVRLKQLWSA